MKKKIKAVFTGGGSAGHVVPCLPLIEELLDSGWNVHYVGSYTGVERRVITNRAIDYSAIFTGKFRRYFSWQNFLDPIKIILGIFQAIIIIFRLKPQVIFSKGGFVAFPVVLAGWLNRVPIIVHESDITPGLANKLSFFFAKKVCLTFPNVNLEKSGKFIYTGTPIRNEIVNGEAELGKNICKFTKEIPVLLFIGGGNGSEVINNLVEKNYDVLIKKFNIIQITGISNRNNIIIDPTSHVVFKYVEEGLAHLFAYADCIVSRAGSNIIHEILAISKPHILIPLSSQVSRGEQRLNAEYFQNNYGSVVLQEEQLDSEFINVLYSTMQETTSYRKKLSSHKFTIGNKKVISIIKEYM